MQLAATRVEERKMEQARRRDAARFKREENTKLERKRLMAALEERRTRTDRAEAAAKRQLRATLWLALLHGGCFARASGRGLGAGRKRIAARRWQHAAVAVVQRLARGVHAVFRGGSRVQSEAARRAVAPLDAEAELGDVRERLRVEEPRVFVPPRERGDARLLRGRGRRCARAVRARRRRRRGPRAAHG